MLSKQTDCRDRLQSAGVTWADASALRRISMTLHRWHELECGDGNDHGSWCITRGHRQRVGLGVYQFIHEDDGKPFLEHHHYLHGKAMDYVTYSPMADRERGAHKRLAAIMARYPNLVSYVQTDPRGCALYILPRDAVLYTPADQIYNSRGIAVHK